MTLQQMVQRIYCMAVCAQQRYFGDRSLYFEANSDFMVSPRPLPPPQSQLTDLIVSWHPHMSHVCVDAWAPTSLLFTKCKRLNWAEPTWTGERENTRRTLKEWRNTAKHNDMTAKTDLTKTRSRLEVWRPREDPSNCVDTERVKSWKSVWIQSSQL